MNPELEELLAAAKVMFTENTVEEAGRLHKAITAFEAVALRDVKSKFVAAPDPYDFENKGLRMKP